MSYRLTIDVFSSTVFIQAFNTLDFKKKYFTQVEGNPCLFELHNPTANSAVTFTIMKTVIAR